MRTVFVAFAILCVAPACQIGPKRYRSSPSFRAEDLTPSSIRRVVFVPIEDEANAGIARQAVQESLSREFEKATSIEIVTIDTAGHLEMARHAPPRRSGQYPLEAILALATRHGADAVLFGAVTAYRPYAPQRLGVRLDLISAETGLLLWSVFSDFDMSDEDAKNTLERVYRTQAAATQQSLSWDQAQNSPARFAQLVASEAIATLKKKK
jgi:hypothetical protein